MALKSTVFKLTLNVADLDRNVYEDFALTVARHPSETDARMMLRVLAFALHASRQLSFGRGISTDDEPDLWQKSLSGEVELWIDLGTPDPDRIRKACNRSGAVALYTYGDRAAPVWWDKHGAALGRFDNLEVWQVADAESARLAEMVGPGMGLQCTISEGDVLVGDGEVSVSVRPVKLLG